MASETNQNSFPWINPVGGQGDALMLSGVLKMVHERNHGQRYNLIRRTDYTDILTGHPAIADIGHPPADASLTHMTYWSLENIGPGAARPFQILARTFGLKTPVEERLWISGDGKEDKLLTDFLPWKKTNIAIAASSASPKKEMSLETWKTVVAALAARDIGVFQVGKASDRHVRGAYSLLGLTTPRQLIMLLRRMDAVITLDNFVMHAAHCAGVRAVAMWGPTSHEVYGYPEQMHVQAEKPCDPNDPCIGAGKGAIPYSQPCPQKEKHCLDTIEPQAILAGVERILPSK
jgi:ADP-heptose:LPS heptosyltransferase